MSLEDIIKEEIEFAKYEYQVKFETDIEESALIRLGARKLGTVIHEDRFFIAKDKTLKSSDELIRVRKEGDEDFLFTYKGPVARQRFRNRIVVNRIISSDEVKEIEADYREVISLNKRRVIFVLGKVRILVDKVDNLGSFVEFDVEKESGYGELDPTLKELNLDPKDAIQLSYFELALIKTQPLKRFLFKIYYKLEKVTFGMSSAVMTVMGLIVGLVAAQQPLAAILGGIVSIGIADSMSDAVSVYTAKKSERGSSDRVAFKNAVYTFWSKLIFSLSFVVIFLAFPADQAVFISITWGLVLLASMHFFIAYVREEKIFLNIFKNVGLAAVVILASFLAGSLVAAILKD